MRTAAAPQALDSRSQAGGTPAVPGIAPFWNRYVRQLMNHFVIGDWMGSLYTAAGRRCDLFLFLDRDGRYERTARMEPDHDVRDTGRWQYDPTSRALRLIPDAPEAAVRWSSDSGLWTVLTVSGCEDSNVLLVLRPVALAARNLPVVLYRVHCNGRGYGSGWEQQLPKP